MEDGGRDDGLECAGRCLQAALAHTDRLTVAALLRAAARYPDRDAAGERLEPQAAAFRVVQT